MTSHVSDGKFMTRRAARAWIAVALVLGASMKVGQAQAQVPSPEPPATEIGQPPTASAMPDAALSAPAVASEGAVGEVRTQSLQERAQALGAELRAAIATQPAQVERKAGEIRTLREKSGASGFPDEARAIAAGASQALERGDLDAAESQLQMGLEAIDPGNPDLRLHLAALERRRSAFNPGFLVELVRAFQARLLRLSSAPYVATSLLVPLAAGILLTALVVLASLLLRRQKLLRHDVEEMLKSRMDGEVAKVGGFVVLLLPLLLTFDLYWTSLYWAVLIWAYLSIPERIVGTLALLLAAGSVAAVGVSTRLLDATPDPYGRAASAYIEGAIHSVERTALGSYGAEHADDREAQILQALVSERDGDARAATEVYRKMLEGRPSAEILNNLANVYYRLEEKDKAFEYWNKALAIDPRFAQAHCNLKIYYFEFLEFDKGNEQFNKAKELNPALVNQWVRNGSRIIDAEIKVEEVRARLWAASSRPQDAFQAALTSPPFIGAGLSLVLGFALAAKRRGRVAADCIKCGQAFCSECKSGQERQDYCLQCVHLFLRKGGVSPQMRTEKMKQIASHQSASRIRAIAAGLVAPGSGHILRGSTLLGFVFVAVTALGLAFAGLGGKVVAEPGLLPSSAAAIPWTLGLVVAAAGWVVANLTNFTQKG